MNETVNNVLRKQLNSLKGSLERQLSFLELEEKSVAECKASIAQTQKEIADIEKALN